MAMKRKAKTSCTSPPFSVTNMLKSLRVMWLGSKPTPPNDLKLLCRCLNVKQVHIKIETRKGKIDRQYCHSHTNENEFFMVIKVNKMKMKHPSPKFTCFTFVAVIGLMHPANFDRKHNLKFLLPNDNVAWQRHISQVFPALSWHHERSLYGRLVKPVLKLILTGRQTDSTIAALLCVLL